MITDDQSKTVYDAAAASSNRIAALRKVMNSRRIDAFVVSSLPHIRYLTNFSGSSAVLLILHDGIHFLTDGRYAEQIRTELYALDGLCTHITRSTWQCIAEHNLLQSCETVGFEAAVLSWSAVQAMRKQLRTRRGALTGRRFVPCTSIIERLIMSKTADEVAHIRAAAAIADSVYRFVLEIVKPSMCEHDIAAEISYQARKRGSEADAFDIIVASGVRGALPHGRASNKLLQSGELVTIDFGCEVQGFCCDITRTFALGKPSEFDASVYALVLEANKRAIAAARAGISCKRLDAVARDFLARNGYTKEFEHSLGHGLGLEVHELPSVSARSLRSRIPAGAVITIEPGVYIPGRCGVRIEDDIWIHESGCDVLTEATPKELLVV